MKKKISVFLILICGTLCACSGQKDDAVVATETPKVTGEAVKEENLISTPMSTEEREQAGYEEWKGEDSITDEISPEEKRVLERYQEAVTKLAEDNIFPNGQQAGPYLFEGEDTNNYYKIMDIDRDGRQELIIHYPDACCMAAMVYYIFEYDTENGQFHQELAEFPAVQIYENGILIAQSSHNHGRSNLDDFWPYTVYQYKSETDTFELFARVDAWQSMLFEEDEPDEDFPYDQDADGDGVIYYLADPDTYEPAVIMDWEEYENWRANLTNGADEIEIEYEKLSAIEQQEDSKIFYGTWVIEKAVLCSEMYTGTTKDGVDEEDLYNPEDYIGYELEYSDEFFRLGDKKYENPQYVENYVTLEDFNDGGRFKTPTVYDVIDNEQIQVGNGETNILETEVMMCIVDFEGETEYNGYSFIPVGTEIVLLNEDIMLVGVWGEILIARRIREDDSCAEPAGAVEKLGLGEENYDFLVDCTGDSYAELKSTVDKIDFSSTFPPGEDLFGEEYRQLILCKTPFWVPETGKEIYLNQLKQLDNFMLDSYELDELVYYYFDIDGDNVAELGVTDEINFRYLFDYSEQDKRIILWKEMSSTWYNIIGTRKICWNNGGNNIAFYSLGEDGKDEVTIRLYSWEGPNKETGLVEIYYTVTFPNQEEYFSVTKEQYEEITGRYFEAEKESRQKIGEVSYSYQEMLELLNKEQGSCNSQSKTDKIEVLECIYADEQSNAEIYYPKLIGFNDKDKEKKINELIFKDIERVAIEGKNEIGKDFTIELKYDMKFIDENIISIFYYGMYGENSEGHGLSATAITTNIDINNEKLIMLKDIIIDYEELGRLLLSDKFRGITVWEGIRGTDTISREYLGNEEKLVENLKNEEFDIKNHYIEWYIDGDEFVIVSLFSSIYQEYSMEIESMGEIFSEYFYELHKREHKVSSVDR